MTVRARRVYEAPDAADGRRVLVDRLWPRGLAKAAAHIDECAILTRRALAHLRELTAAGPVTLLTATRDLEHSQAADLAERLRRVRAGRQGFWGSAHDGNDGFVRQTAVTYGYCLPSCPGTGAAQARYVNSATITEPSRQTPVYGEFDVVVVGGGPAGIMAATAAARAGCSTLLIERYGFLGGAGTAGGLSTFCGLHARTYGEDVRVIRGLADELLDRLVKLDGLNAPHLTIADGIAAQAFDISAYKIAADELVTGVGRADPVPRDGRRRGAWPPTGRDRRGADRVEVRPAGGARAVLHRRVRRRRPGRLGGRAVGEGAARRRDDVPVADVPHQRRRRRQGGPGPVAHRRAADGRGGAAGHAHVPAQEADRPAAAQPARVAGQPDPAAHRGRRRDRRHRRRRADPRRADRAAAGAGRVHVHQGPDAGLRGLLHRRHRAADRHPRDPPHHRRRTS